MKNVMQIKAPSLSFSLSFLALACSCAPVVQKVERAGTPGALSVDEPQDGLISRFGLVEFKGTCDPNGAEIQIRGDVTEYDLNCSSEGTFLKMLLLENIGLNNIYIAQENSAGNLIYEERETTSLVTPDLNAPIMLSVDSAGSAYSDAAYSGFTGVQKVSKSGRFVVFISSQPELHNASISFNATGTGLNLPLVYDIVTGAFEPLVSDGNDNGISISYFTNAEKQISSTDVKKVLFNASEDTPTLDGTPVLTTGNVFYNDGTSIESELVSVGADGSAPTGYTVNAGFGIALSDDGKTALFGSRATNLVANEVTTDYRLFHRDLDAKITKYFSVTGSDSYFPSNIQADLSGDGKWAFIASSIAPDGTYGGVSGGNTSGLFMWSLEDNTVTTIIDKTDSGGGQLYNHITNEDGDKLFFTYNGTNIPGFGSVSTTYPGNLYLYTRTTDSYQVLNRDTSGTIVAPSSVLLNNVDDVGQMVLFNTREDAMWDGNLNGVLTTGNYPVVMDIDSDERSLVMDPSTTWWSQGNYSIFTKMSGDGRYIILNTQYSLDASDTNDRTDIYLYLNPLAD